ncbi:hypothetical protein VTO73DRAFT_6182 [Trametes versicolor]
MPELPIHSKLPRRRSEPLCGWISASISRDHRFWDPSKQAAHGLI